MKALIVLTCLIVCQTIQSSAQHVIEAGTGWQNTGATYNQTWHPAIKGSRKDVPAFIGWRRIGENRMFYTPYARLIYTNFWSIGGAGNLLSTGISPAGLGVYLTKSPSDFDAEERNGNWYVSARINATLRFGFNLTPNGPKSDRVADPVVHRDSLLNHYDPEIHDLLTLEQRYPFGEYSYLSVAFPVQLQFTKRMKSGLGIGFFIESSIAIMEWSFEGNNHPPAYGYNIMFGMNFEI